MEYRIGSVAVFLAGSSSPGSLEGSYERAFRRAGHKVIMWDVPASVAPFTRFGRIGAYVNSFWPTEAWLIKANREFLYSVLDARPDVVAVFASHQILAGALGQIKAALPDTQLILIWPDTLLHCPSLTVQSIPVYDLIATYSSSSIEGFRRLGARRCEWVPLGFDPELHPPEAGTEGPSKYSGDYDACFVGNHSSEREEAVVHLVNHGFRVAVWGSPGSWHRARNQEAMKRYFKGGPLVAHDLSAAVKAAPVSLNLIAKSNFPAANMRFFEIPGAGGVPLSAQCPEFAGEFPDQEACFYYDGPGNIAQVLRRTLDDGAARERVQREGHARVMASHTYAHRARRILDLLHGEKQPASELVNS